MKLFVIDEQQTMWSGQRGEGHTIYREATEQEIRDAFKILGDKRAEEARRARMTDAEKDLEAIEAAGAKEDFEKGNRIIRERDKWKQGGSQLGIMASYEYWDGSKLEWHVPRQNIYPPYWG